MQPRDLSSHVAYVAGRGPEEVARELELDPDAMVTLSSNENPLGPSPRAVEAVRRHAERLHRYPKAGHADLTARLAERHDVRPEQVWLANGGDGAIDYLGRALLEPHDRVLVPEPGFAYYGMSARFHHADVATYPVTKADDFTMDADTVLSRYGGERIIYVTSPHNPSGATMAPDQVEEIARETASETLVVVDEAYGEFAEGPGSGRLVETREDVAILRTFSKAHGLAGLRLGYALVPPAWADAYARVNTPFAVNELACRAGLAALEDDEHLRRSIETARRSRSYMREHLLARTWPSEANFVLVEVGEASAATAELQRSGVIVRDCTSFGLPACIRITCGTESDTRTVVEAVNGLER